MEVKLHSPIKMTINTTQFTSECVSNLLHLPVISMREKTSHITKFRGGISKAEVHEIFWVCMDTVFVKCLPLKYDYYNYGSYITVILR